MIAARAAVALAVPAVVGPLNAAPPPPLFTSPLVTSATAGHAVEIDVDLRGARELYLVVTDGGDGYSCDWADWAEPRLVGDQGELRLTELTWKSASADWGQVRVNQNAAGGPLKIAGQPIPYGMGTHANSVIAFDVPAGYRRFKARGGLDAGGTDQQGGRSTSVQFLVFTERPAISRSGRRGAGGPEQHDPELAASQLEVHAQLECALLASEPLLTNPSNIDIDHRGRIWVCEIVNYRGHRGKRPDGDRILILADTQGDGRIDRQTVFYQAPDLVSSHGICVLATPDGKETRAIVSVGDQVRVFIDEDGDDRADRQEVLFRGISGTQHDHGIHAFVFGPDGKLYFNFGNAGNQLKDAQGQPVVDLAGIEVAARRKPYQQGMVFRCNLDGSQLETLGWNFRNNWEVTVDSFGSLWQSDNDDDGNRGVRINFVMEFGNYGYCDELTGAGWGEGWKRAQAEGAPEDERASYHWHLHDPGVVPNLLHTGAGSPTGITVYEGRALPAELRGALIHCDAGPNVCRAYTLADAGAGYRAETVDLLVGTRNKWFRPSDVSVAPDGSLVVADWYDPGVGGHGAGDLERGRLFRVTARGQAGRYAVPRYDFGTPEGAAEALKSPNDAARYVAWTTLHALGPRAEPALAPMLDSDDPVYRARALWVLGKLDGRGPDSVQRALKDADPRMRIVGLRLARQLQLDLIPLVRQLVRDPSPAVRRECAIALRHNMAPRTAELWAELALQHDEQDRWYLEALGIGADRQWDACLAAWLAKVGPDWKQPAGREIVWRSRAARTGELLADLIRDETTTAEHRARYFRAFDFLQGPEKDAALKGLLGL